MKFAPLCLLSVWGGVIVGSDAASAHSRSPVEKVVKLLKDLKASLQTDAKTESQVYDKYACWCEKSTARKASNIETANMDLRALGQDILKYKATVAVRAAEIAKLSSDIKANQEIQAELTAIRSKENGAFMAETSELKEALAAMQLAILTLVKATTSASALLQESSQAQSRAAVKAALEALPSKVDLPVKHMSMLSSFVSAGTGYAPQSATIQGILADMYTTFSRNLESSTVAEGKANRDYEKEMATKIEAENTMTATMKRKEAEKASAEASLAESTTDFDDTTEQKNADIAFFDTTVKDCTEKSEEWKVRKALRAEELEGVEKALEILTSDAARDTFISAIKAGKETGADPSIKVTSFLQLGSSDSAKEAVAKAYGAIKAQATHAQSFRLAALAVRIRTAKVGHFDEVIKAMDQMTQVLKDEGAADLAKKTQCIEEYKDIASTVGDTKWLIEKNEAKIAKLEMKIAATDKKRLSTIEEIDSTQAYIDAITEQRNADHLEFKAKKAEDEEAVRLLESAKTVLLSYYKNHSIDMGPIQGSVKGVLLNQQNPVFDVSEDQAPDAIFSHKSKQAGKSKSIVSIMTYIIQDVVDEIRNGVTNEEKSLAAYTAAFTEATKLKEDLVKKRINLEGVIATAQGDKTDETQTKERNELALKTELEYKAKITPDCDWILENFDSRATARAAEMKGISEAKEFLAGYQAPALVEKSKTFDDRRLSQIRFLGLAH
mmetsp:Transcript_161960/g.295714  ORF Transcript_161960/g.295714 Transcript_161960/m.295714 type:complete len:724 (+) Transcript_161960:59-2230(+)